MERQNSDSSRGIGRGRPVEGELRRPFRMYSGSNEYVPVEGSDNALRLSINDPPQNDIGPNGGGEMHFRQVHAPFNHTSPNPRANPEKKFELSPLAPEFVPRNFRPDPPQNNAPSENNFDDPIQVLKNSMYEITMNPAMFETRVQSLAICLIENIQTEETLQEAVNVIFDESMQQSNFRYNGARLASFLCTALVERVGQYNFKELLLNRCQLQLEQRDNLARFDSGVSLRGYAMFLAELMSQIEVPNPRVPLFGESLTTVLKTLLEYSSYDNLKCICQILKLVGSYMEDSERNKSSSVNQAALEMDKLINMLKVVSDEEEYPRDIRTMVTNVVELRSNNWGRSSEDESTTDNGSPASPPNEPVLYGPDGKPLSAEESNFLHAQYSYSASDAEDFDTYEGEEMEEEIEAAYEVFLNELSHID